MSHAFVGLAKWVGSQPREIGVYTACTTVIKGIPHSSAGCSEITWNNWLKLDIWESTWSNRRGDP